MRIELFEIGSVQGFLVCATRIASLIGTMPVFGSPQIPVRMRIGLALAVALAIFPVLAPGLPTGPLPPFGLSLLVAQESLVGLMIGFVARLVFSAVELAGSVIGYQMGFAAANVLDPQNQQQSPLIAQFQNVLALLIFLALDMHHLFLRVIADSYRLLPAGTLSLGGGAVPFIINLTGAMFSLAIRFSAPVLTVLLLSGLVLGLMARVFPQLNVFMLSFPVNIGLALTVMGLTMHLMAQMLTVEFAALQNRFMQLLSLL